MIQGSIEAIFNQFSWLPNQWSFFSCCIQDISVHSYKQYEQLVFCIPSTFQYEYRIWTPRFFFKWSLHFIIKYPLSTMMINDRLCPVASNHVLRSRGSFRVETNLSWATMAVFGTHHWLSRPNNGWPVVNRPVSDNSSPPLDHIRTSGSRDRKLTKCTNNPVGSLRYYVLASVSISRAGPQDGAATGLIPLIGR